MTRDDTDEVRISSITEQKMRLVHAVGTRLERMARARPTDILPDDTLIAPTPSHLGSGPLKGSPDQYLAMPAGAETAAADPSFPHWRVELHTAGPYDIALGMDVYGDVLMGRGTDDEARPDVDLDLFRALEFGVSRRHAILRPTRQALYLIDLGSTNGTRCNGMTLGPGQAHPLQHNDVFSLGNMVFLVKIVQRPEMQTAEDEYLFIRKKI